MAEESALRGIIDFFGDIGIYDVVLPFLLVFTIIFAFLEKSKILGTVTIEGVTYTKKNLNSIVAFSIAFFVVASTKLVAVLNEGLANIALILIIIFSFLLLIGSFYKEGEDVFLEGGWRIAFMAVSVISVVLIFLWAIKTDDGEPWLKWFWYYMEDHWSSNLAGSIIIVIVIVFFMWFITKDPKARKTETKKS
ncbi:hypothetical protein JW968_05085 [Candidatus Woesearchaeota archaeon]|nr:hypothetical protein [Candidatus Woesearchaeota archaeon]